MKRRRFLATSAAAAPAAMAQSGEAARSFIELRYFYLRNGMDNQRSRMNELLITHALPALKRAGVQTAGVFGSSLGPDTPYLMLMMSFPSWAAIDETRNKISADAAYQKEAERVFALPGLPYVRQEVQILKAFAGFPQVEIPPQDPKRPGRLFELRTYESNHALSLRKKIGMFENGETAIFRKTGLTPVFFGETVAGRKMPNLTYMLCFDNFAQREANWAKFIADPEWAKLRATPGLSDAEIVSNISTSFLSPVNGSPIR